MGIGMQPISLCMTVCFCIVFIDLQTLTLELESIMKMLPLVQQQVTDTMSLYLIMY